MSNSCRRVNVSFKNNQRDNALLKIIKGKNDKSDYVKNCIEFYEKHHGTKSEVATTKRKVKF